MTSCHSIPRRRFRRTELTNRIQPCAIQIAEFLPNLMSTSLPFSWMRILFSAALVAALAGCAQRHMVMAMPPNLSAPSGSPVILAAYQAWFGAPGHIDVGYNSLDPGVLANQIEKAKMLGIQAFVVNWYGSHGADARFQDRSYGTLQHLAVLHGFKTAILYDEDPDPSHSTESAIHDFEYAYQHYIGPDAPDHDAYLTYNGRPMIFIFPKEGQTDWGRVRE